MCHSGESSVNRASLHKRKRMILKKREDVHAHTSNENGKKKRTELFYLDDFFLKKEGKWTIHFLSRSVI